MQGHCSLSLPFIPSNPVCRAWPAQCMGLGVKRHPLCIQVLSCSTRLHTRTPLAPLTVPALAYLGEAQHLRSFMGVGSGDGEVEHKLAAPARSTRSTQARSVSDSGAALRWWRVNL